MVGDDVKSDTQGGLRAGLSGILVQTGKYTKGDEDVQGAPQALPPPPPTPFPLGAGRRLMTPRAEGPSPSFVAPTVAEAIDWALQHSDL